MWKNVGGNLTSREACGIVKKVILVSLKGRTRKNEKKVVTRGSGFDISPALIAAPERPPNLMKRE